MNTTSRFWSDRSERVLDLTLASLCLLVLGPVILCCMLWVKLRDGGPCLYRQQRLGQSGRPFDIYKIRSMRQNAEASGAQFADVADARIIPGCGWLRKTHLDELPQLFNVLRGEMSMVGPRPERPEFAAEIQSRIPEFSRRLEVKPGLTGLAQLRHGYTADTKGARRKLLWDKRYIHKRSVAFDVYILLYTIPKLWDDASR